MTKRRDIITFFSALVFVIGLCVLSPAPVSAAITGTGTCPDPVPTPLTGDLTCDGNIFITDGSVLDIGGNVANVTLDVGSGTICVGSDPLNPPCDTLSGVGTIIVDPLGPGGTLGTIIAANVVIGANSFIHADGTGCGSSESYNAGLPGCENKGSGVTAGFGEGADGANSGRGGGGAGHGGMGGNGYNNLTLAGEVYGDSISPATMGSGGGDNPTTGAVGGAGGGAIRINLTGDLTVDGVLSANGASGNCVSSACGGGGSGGSLWISVANLSGSGTINANGGNGGNSTYDGGGGAGGLIEIDYTGTMSPPMANVTVSGGTGGNSAVQGQAGSLFITSNLVPPDVILGGNTTIPGGVSYQSVTMIDQSGAGSETVTVSGNLTLPSGAINFSASTLLNVTGDLDMSGVDYILPVGGLLRIDGTWFLNSLTVDGTYDTTGGTITTTAGIMVPGTISGSITINAGTDVSIPGTIQGNPTLNVTGNLVVEGSINANLQGCGPSQSYDPAIPGCANKGNGTLAGFGEGGDGYADGGGGAGHAGRGGTSSRGSAGGYSYGDPFFPDTPGSGGGTDTFGTDALGGPGGGAIRLLVLGTLSIDGSVTANAGNGECPPQWCAGGGSGGSIWITAGSVSGTGVIGARGGNGGNFSADGGGGSGGRIAIYYTGGFTFPTPNLNVGGGSASSTAFPGAAGSLYVTNSGPNPDLILGGNFSLPADPNANSLVLVGQSGVQPPLVSIGSDLDLSGSDLTIPANQGLQVDGVITVDNLTVAAGGSLAANGTGCPSGQGYDVNAGICTSVRPDAPGLGMEGLMFVPNFRGAGGGGYGGKGGDGQLRPGSGGQAYGSYFEPAFPGSSGGDARIGLPESGGAGGGVIRIIASGAVTVDGTISANGVTDNPTWTTGGGSGGSIWISTTNLGGSGTIRANGGEGGKRSNANGGGGAGGRVYIDCGTCSTTVTLQAMGGNGSSAEHGEAGSVFMKDRQALPTVMFGGNGITLTDADDNTPGDGLLHYQNLLIVRVGTTNDRRSLGSQPIVITTPILIESNLLFSGQTVSIQDSLTVNADFTSAAPVTVSGPSLISGTLRVSSLSLTLNGSTTAGSTLWVSGGTLNANAPATAGDLVSLTGGNAFFRDTLSVLNPGGALTVSGGEHSAFNSVMVSDLTTVNGGGIFRLIGNAKLESTTINVSQANSRLRMEPGSTFTKYPSIIAADIIIGPSTGNMNTEPRIDANGAGCPAEAGFNVQSGSSCSMIALNAPGRGVTGQAGSGGGYGGAGGMSGDGKTGGATYGTPEIPLLPGSGGGRGQAAGGAGGGVALIQVDNLLTVDGIIESNGGNGVTASPAGSGGGGGGSGGSVYIRTDSLAGAGLIRANGGVGGSGGPLGGGGGGGGRAAVYHTAGLSTFSGLLECLGGNFGAGSVQNGVAGDNNTGCSLNPVTPGLYQPDGVIEGNGDGLYGNLRTGDGGEAVKPTSGEALSYSFEIQNDNTSGSDSYHVSWETPTGWRVTVSDGVSEYSGSFVSPVINLGGFQTYFLNVVPPSFGLPGPVNIVVDITSTSDPGAVDSIRAVVNRSSERPDGIIGNNGNNIFGGRGSGAGGESTKKTVGGTTANYSLTVENQQTVSDTFSLTWALPPGWTGLAGGGEVTLNDGIADQVSGYITAPIPAGGSRFYTLKITPPAGETFSQGVVVDILSTTNPTLGDSVRAVMEIENAADASPPAIQNITVSALTPTAATITWNTDEVADSEVEYGTDPSYGNLTGIINSPVLTNGVSAHSVTLNGLTGDTLYHFRVRSRDADGNLSVSEDLNFRYRMASDIASTVVANPAMVAANGVEASNISVTLRTLEGLPVTGKTVTLSSSRGAVDTLFQPSTLTDSNGQATGRIVSGTRGVSVISAQDMNDSVAITNTATVIFTQGLRAWYPMDRPDGDEIGLGDLDGVPDVNLMGLWNLNEGTGTSFSDSSGNGNTGTINAVTEPWVKDPSNPVLPPGSIWDLRVIYNTVIKNGGTYTMWYGASNGTVWQIGRATSPDGLSWTKDPVNPVLPPGLSGEWDDAGVVPGTVIFEGGVYKMWYAGLNGTNWQIGYATSPDGILWTKDPGNPIFPLGAAGTWEDFHTYISPSVMNDGGTYKMWYSGNDGTFARIGYATSPDGVTWTRHPGNPIMDLGLGGRWNDRHVYNPEVIKINGMFYMVYAGHDGSIWRIGDAVSADGITWNLNPGNPVINLGAAGAWDDRHVMSGALLEEGGVLRMWFSGHNGSIWSGIGHATSALTFGWSNSGKFGESLVFNGLADSAVIADPGVSSLDLADRFTFEAWVRPERVVNEEIILAKELSYMMGLRSGTLQYAIYTAGSWSWIDTGLAVEPGTWSHVALTYDGTTVTGYVNGVAEASPNPDPQGGPVLQNDNPLCLASRGAACNVAGRYFMGRIDGVAIFNIPLTAMEIQNHYSRGVAEDATKDLPSEFEPNDGTLFGPLTTAGRVNEGITFDGKGDFVEVEDHPTVQFSAGDFSIESWVKTTQAPVPGTFPAILDKEDGAAIRQGYGMGLDGDNANRPFVTITSGGASASVTSGTLVNDGIWHHIVATRTATDICIYVDGGVPDCAAHSLGIMDNESSLRIGRKAGSNGDYFQGELDEVRLYSYALTPAEVAAAMTAPLSDPSPPVDSTPPVISAVSPTGAVAGGSTVTVTWTTDEPATSRVEYGTSDAYGIFSPLDSTLKVSHSLTLSGLSGGTPYHYRVISGDSAGNVSVSPDTHFTTAADAAAPVISGVTVSNITPTSALISWTTDEPSDSRAEYGETAGYGSLTGLSDTAPLVTSHSVLIGGLSEGSTYHFRALSRDAAGNQAESSDLAFNTVLAPIGPPLAPTALPPAVVDGTSIQVFWIDNSTNETGFRVERAPQVGGTCDVDENYGVIYSRLQDSLASAQTGRSYGTTDSGLLALTTYCYRFQAFNSIGFAYSSSVSATTAGPAAGGPPGTVIDLAVERGTQRAQSMTLSWSAPPEDATVPGVGSVESYDLRVATVPILDGGAGLGQIDFSDAMPVPTPAVPKPAGILEQATVTGLTPNTIYYFALKSIDAFGFVSAMSNLAGGDNVRGGDLSGRTALRTGFNLVSVPLQLPLECDPPADIRPGGDPDCVFGDDIGGTPKLSEWISSGLGVSDGCYGSYPITNSDCLPQQGISSVSTGTGYFLLGGGANPVIDVPAGSVDVTPATLCGVSDSYAVPLALGWNIVGSPFPDKVPAASLLIRQNGNDASCLSLAGAVAANWVGNAFYQYDGQIYQLMLYNDPTTVLEPWKGYWFYVGNNGLVDGTAYELIVPLP